jgi:hypothetical protein
MNVCGVLKKKSLNSYHRKIEKYESKEILFYFIHAKDYLQNIEDSGILLLTICNFIFNIGVHKLFQKLEFWKTVDCVLKTILSCLHCANVQFQNSIKIDWIAF